MFQVTNKRSLQLNAGGREGATYHKLCYNILLSSFSDVVLIVRIAINLVFPERIVNVRNGRSIFIFKVSQTSLTSTVGERLMSWACLTTINQSCTMIGGHLLKTGDQL